MSPPGCSYPDCSCSVACCVTTCKCVILLAWSGNGPDHLPQGGHEMPAINKSLAVERGAKLPDARRPGWADEIDVDELEMESTCNCIVGQLNNGSYLEGLWALDLNDDSANDYGFDAYDDSENPHRWYELRQAWIEEIEERRAND